MDVVTFVPDASLRKLRARFSHHVTLRSETLSGLQLRVAQARPSTLIIDPGDLRADASESIIAAATDAGWRVVVYAELTSLISKRILEVGNRAPIEVVFHGGEELSLLFRQRIGSMSTSSVPALLLQRFTPALRRIPSAMQEHAVALFGWLPIPESTAAFVQRRSIHPRTIYSWVSHAGLVSPSHLLCCARLARAWHYVTESTLPLERAAVCSGMRSERTLTEQFRRLVGISPRRASRCLSAEEFADRIVGSAARQPCAIVDHKPENAIDARKLPEPPRECLA